APPDKRPTRYFANPARRTRPPGGSWRSGARRARALFPARRESRHARSPFRHRPRRRTRFPRLVVLSLQRSVATASETIKGAPGGASRAGRAKRLKRAGEVAGQRRARTIRPQRIERMGEGLREDRRAADIAINVFHG